MNMIILFFHNLAPVDKESHSLESSRFFSFWFGIYVFFICVWLSMKEPHITARMKLLPVNSVAPCRGRGQCEGQ